MENAEEELKRRRERGRLAQSAFRRRQAQAQQDTKAENSSLKSAIADILSAVGDVECPLLRSKILHAATVAGVESSSLAATVAPPATIARREDVQPVSLTAGNGSSTTSSTSSLPLCPAHISQHPLSSWTAQNVLQMSRFQPEDYVMIHPDPFHLHQDTSGVSLALQFLGPAAFTFSGCIFWHVIGRKEALLRAQARLLKYKQQAMREQHVFTTGPSDCLEEPSMLMTELVPATRLARGSGPEDWLPLIEDRIEYFKRRGERYAATRVGAQPVLGPLRTPSAADELSPRLLTPVAVERRIRASVGDTLFAALVGPAVSRFEQDHSYYMKDKERGEAVLVDGLLDLLWENHVCGGSGPMWDAAVFDQIFAGWCASVTGHHV